jgi:hypothetical protein
LDSASSSSSMLWGGTWRSFNHVKANKPILPKPHLHHSPQPGFGLN